MLLTSTNYAALAIKVLSKLLHKNILLITSNDGSLTTLHANSTKEAVLRLAMMVRYGVDIPVDVIESYIASALDLVIQTVRGLDGQRFVTEVSELFFDEEARRCNVRPLYCRIAPQDAGTWIAMPSFLDDLISKGLVSEGEVAAWTAQHSF